MSHERSPTRLLLVEDDPISRSFLSEALSALPAQVDCAQDIAGALRLAGEHRHALWLIDAHLPDGEGGDCIKALRGLRGVPVPALAITAGVSREELDELCATGFVEVLLKPVSIALLQATVRRLLGEKSDSVREPGGGKLPVWDEARALAAIGGNRDSLQALRKLFLDELPALHQQMDDARSSGDVQSMQAVLHKLKAGCGFVGAARLAQAVTALAHDPLDADGWRRFGFAASDALDWEKPQG
jgi:DNA-binding response OmpR family regulator